MTDITVEQMMEGEDRSKFLDYLDEEERRTCEILRKEFSIIRKLKLEQEKRNAETLTIDLKTGTVEVFRSEKGCPECGSSKDRTILSFDCSRGDYDGVELCVPCITSMAKCYNKGERDNNKSS